MKIEKLKLESEINDLEIHYRELEIEVYKLKNKILIVEIELEEAEITFEEMAEFCKESITGKSDKEVDDIIKRIESDSETKTTGETELAVVSEDDFKFYSAYKYGAYKLLLNDLNKERLATLEEIQVKSEKLLELYED